MLQNKAITSSIQFFGDNINEVATFINQDISLDIESKFKITLYGEDYKIGLLDWIVKDVNNNIWFYKSEVVDNSNELKYDSHEEDLKELKGLYYSIIVLLYDICKHNLLDSDTIEPKSIVTVGEILPKVARVLNQNVDIDNVSDFRDYFDYERYFKIFHNELNEEGVIDPRDKRLFKIYHLSTISLLYGLPEKSKPSEEYLEHIDNLRKLLVGKNFL